MKQLALDIGLAREPAFETFHGQGNEPALQALQALGPGEPPVYLWGPTGCGKTHLLRALATLAREQGRHCAWFDAGASGSWQLEREPDLLVLDQAEAWNPTQQHAAFSAFVRTVSVGGAVASAGRLPPVDLPLREDIRTRLGWGHVVRVWPLGESELRRVLRDDALQRGLRLSEDVLDYLLRRVQRDLKSLTDLLERLDRYALSLQRPLTVPLVRQMLEDERQTEPSVPPPEWPNA